MDIEDEVCSKCGCKEIYIQADGKTLKCYKCKNEWLAYWVKKPTHEELRDRHPERYF